MYSYVLLLTTYSKYQKLDFHFGASVACNCMVAYFLTQQSSYIKLGVEKKSPLLMAQ